MDDRTGIILRGQLGRKLPVQRSKLVRIFTSSTFTDTSVERNALMREIYPRLKDYCKSRHGLDFQVIDMRWGVRDEATDDHMTSELCMKEIAACQRLSVGPNFVTFLCQKYGYRPFPPKIPASIFDLLRETLVSCSQPVDLLDEWFLLDENTLPPVYILQPISSKLPYFSRQDEPDKMKADQGQWWNTFETIQSQLKLAASTCASEGKLNEEQARQFIISVTHDEVTHGLLEAPGNKDDHCLCFIRKFGNLKNNNGVREARNFIDVQDGEIDEEAQKLLDNLRDVDVPKVLSTAKIYVNDLPDWTEKGVDMNDDVYQKYLASFLDTFYKEMVSMIDGAMSKAKQENITNPLCVEILQHLSFCKTKCVGFQGREDLLEQVKGYVVKQAGGHGGGTKGSPLILYGESGSGKTSVLAKCASEVSSNWLEKTDVATVIRFLGTSPSSASVRRLLHSLCQQIYMIYNGKESADVPEDYIKLVTAFTKSLRLATAEKPLVIFLDSLDQLSSDNGAYRMAWLPKVLPDYVAIIVSTLPKEHGILEALQSLLPKTTSSLQVAPFSHDESAKVVGSWLTSSNKAIGSQQHELMTQVTKECSLPLFLKLVFDELCRWRSYHAIKECILFPSVADMISLIFDRLEDYHGKMLISRALAYLTIAPGGIAESELEDLLSLDDDVLNDVYQFWLPPVRRIPPSLWTRAKSDISSYLVEREADGVNVVFWYHRQFIETARKRYLHDNDLKRALHVKCSEYFQGVWSNGRKKPCRYSDRQLQMFGVPKEAEEDRVVAAQPLVFQNDDNKGETRYNLRKLTQLPFHLIESGDLEGLKRHVLCNFDFLSCKLDALSIQEVLGDFERAEEKLFDEEADLIGDSLRLSASVLAKEPAKFAPELVGRLIGVAEKHSNIKVVVDRAREICGLTFPITPVNTCLQPPGGLLLTSLEGHSDSVVAVQVTSDSRLVVTGSKDNTARVWTLADGSLLHILKGHREPVYGIEISPDDQQVLTYTHSGEFAKSGKMCVWNLETGDLIHRLKGHTGKNRSNVALSVDGLFAVSGFETKESYDSDEDTDHEDDIKETRNKGQVNNGVVLKLARFSDAEDDDDDEEYIEVTRDEDDTQMVVGVWSMDSGDMLYWLLGHKGEMKGITTVEVDERQVAISYSRDYTMIFWDLANGQVIRRIQDHNHFDISVVQLSHDKRHLAIHGNNVSIHRSDGKHLFDMSDEDGSSSSVGSFHFTRDNARVISAHPTGTVMVFGLEDQKMIRRIDIDEEVDRDYSIVDSVVTPDDRWIVLATGKEDALVYSVDNLDLIAKLPHITTVDKLALTADGSRLLTASEDKNVRVWDMTKIGKEQQSAMIDKHDDIITTISFLHRQDQVVTTAYDGKEFKVWDLKTGKLLKSPPIPNEKSCHDVAITADDKRLIGAGGYQWYILQLPDFTLLNTFHERMVNPSHFVLTPDNQRLVTGIGQPEHTVRIYDLSSGETLSKIKLRSTALQMLSNGMALNQFYSQMYDSTGMTKIIQMVNTNSGQVVQNFNHGDKVLDYAISSDDSMMACGCKDKDVYLWDLSSGSQMTALKGHSGRVQSVAFSPDNQMVASGADGGEVILWSAVSHKNLHSLTGHESDISKTTFSSDSKYLFTGAESDLYVIVWCSKTGARLMTYNTYSIVSELRVSSLSNTVVVGLRDGRLLILRVSDQFDASLSSGKVVSFAKSMAPEVKETNKAENKKTRAVPSSIPTRSVPITNTSSCCTIL